MFDVAGRRWWRRQLAVEREFISLHLPNFVRNFDVIQKYAFAPEIFTRIDRSVRPLDAYIGANDQRRWVRIEDIFSQPSMQ